MDKCVERIVCLVKRQTLSYQEAQTVPSLGVEFHLRLALQLRQFSRC